MLNDLQKFSGAFVEPMGQKRFPGKFARGPGSVSWIIWAIGEMRMRIPTLLDGLDESWEYSRFDVVSRRTPLHAGFSTKASDYIATERGVLPVRWIAPSVVPVRERTPLRWLLHIVSLLQEQFVGITAELVEQLDEVTSLLDGAEAYYAKEYCDELLHWKAQLEGGQHSLLRFRAMIQQHAGEKIVESVRRPDPFPQSVAWHRLRVDFDLFCQPHTLVAARWADATLRTNVSLAELSTLYERWCALKIVNGLVELGWEPLGSIWEKVLIGGEIRFRRDSSWILIWIAPRILADGSHPSGLVSVVGPEQCPDIVIVAPGYRGADAFVLDPTISNEIAHRPPGAPKSKARYLETLEFGDARIIAGVRTSKRVIRSWSATPTTGSSCRLLTDDGRSGVIPMLPGQAQTPAVTAWLQDISEHALAWAK